jgi:hypothetical protein
MNHHYKSVLYYDGQAYYIGHNGSHRRSTKGLKRGNGITNVGRWGNKARRTFICRSLFMFDTQTHCFSLILTYRDDENYANRIKSSKHHLKAFNQWLRRKGMNAYLYTAELGTKAGLLHYHYLVSCPFVPVSEINWAWCKIRGDYSTNAVRGVRIISNCEMATGYASKCAGYASKAAKIIQEGQKEINQKVPDNIRVWQSSYNLVGKECITSSDWNMLFDCFFKKKEFELIEMEHFSIWHAKFERHEVRKLYEFVNTLRIKAKKKEEIAKKKASKHRDLREMKANQQKMFGAYV